MLNRVYLYEIDNPVIIVGAPTGIVYCNQVDGVATRQRELEGFLLPLPQMRVRVFDPVWWERPANHRRGGDDVGWAAICGEIESTIGASGPSRWVQDLRVVDAPDNCEAWIHVTFVLYDWEANAKGLASARFDGVLTWQNCD